MNAASYLPLLALGLAAALLHLRRGRARGLAAEPLVRLREPGSPVEHEQTTRAALRLLILGGGLAVLALLAAVVIVQLGAPGCVAASGAVPCTDGDPLTALPLLSPLLVSLPLLVLGWRELRSL